MANRILAPQLAGIDVTQIDTAAKYPLGMYVDTGTGTAMTRWRYVKSTGTLAQYGTGIITDAWFIGAGATTTLVNSAVVCRLGVTQNAGGLVNGNYSWVATMGNFRLSVLTLCAADALLYTTATAGSLDDTATTKVVGVKITTTAGGATVDEPAWAALELYVG